MTEEQLFALLGRKQAAIEQLSGDYTKAIAVLREIKGGTLDLERLTVNADGTWSLSAPINGRLANLDILGSK